MRVPPTERKGRVHTSTVTVAVSDELQQVEIDFDTNDFKVEWYSGTGCGGQNRNKVQNSCRLIHVPSGVVTTAQTRSRISSLNDAKSAMRERLVSTLMSIQKRAQSTEKKKLHGSGERGDKIRTYRLIDDQVKDHRSDKVAKSSLVLNGNFSYFD